MAGVVKTVVRMGVIGGLVAGAAVVVAGPDRVGALVSQTRTTINKTIDNQIDDPVALRAQLKKLEGEYPRRIAEVRSDLSELERQKQDLTRELAISKRVVQLADADLAQLKGLLSRAENARADASHQIVRVRFDDRSMGVDDAYAKANSISQTRSAYATQAADLERDLGYLTQQENRLSELLATLEHERAEFQTQLWQLDRQVDAIARNERMIEMMEKREATLDRYETKYDANSLAQVKTRLADIRASQEAALESLATSTGANDYERMATFELDGELSTFRERSIEHQDRGVFEVIPNVLEIGPDDCEPDECEKGTMALNRH